MSSDAEKLYFDTNEAARRYSIPARTLMHWREKRRGPVYYRVGNRVLYKAEDLEAFITAGMVEPERRASRRPNFLKGRTGV